MIYMHERCYMHHIYIHIIFIFILYAQFFFMKDVHISGFNPARYGAIQKVNSRLKPQLKQSKLFDCFNCGFCLKIEVQNPVLRGRMVQIPDHFVSGWESDLFQRKNSESLISGLELSDIWSAEAKMCTYLASILHATVRFRR